MRLRREQEGERESKGEKGEGRGWLWLAGVVSHCPYHLIALLLSTGHMLNEPWDGRCHCLLDRPWEEADL